jgi:condensin complex subunit 3
MVSTVASIFQDASTTTASHRKNVNNLLKQSRSNNFTDDLLACVLLLLQAKKDVSNADNTLQFLTTFFNEINDQAVVLPDIFHERLVDVLLSGIQASNKDVRARSSQILALYMNVMDEIHESCLQTIRKVIFERIYDKNASVRINSVICLCRLQVWDINQNAGSDEENDNVQHLLVDLLQHDSQSSVILTAGIFAKQFSNILILKNRLWVAFWSELVILILL